MSLTVYLHHNATANPAKGTKLGTYTKLWPQHATVRFGLERPKVMQGERIKKCESQLVQMLRLKSD